MATGAKQKLRLGDDEIMQSYLPMVRFWKAHACKNLDKVGSYTRKMLANLKGLKKFSSRDKLDRLHGDLPALVKRPGPRAAALVAYKRLAGTKQQAVIQKIATTLSNYYEGHKGGAVPDVIPWAQVLEPHLQQHHDAPLPPHPPALLMAPPPAPQLLAPPPPPTNAPRDAAAAPILAPAPPPLLPPTPPSDPPPTRTLSPLTAVPAPAPAPPSPQPPTSAAPVLPPLTPPPPSRLRSRSSTPAAATSPHPTPLATPTAQPAAQTRRRNTTSPCVPGPTHFFCATLATSTQEPSPVNVPSPIPPQPASDELTNTPDAGTRAVADFREVHALREDLACLEEEQGRLESERAVLKRKLEETEANLDGVCKRTRVVKDKVLDIALRLTAENLARHTQGATVKVEE